MQQEVKNVTFLPQPLHAVSQGKAVRLIAQGDMPGKSPVYLTVNGNGDSTWESFSDVQITDTNCLPISQSALRNIGNAERFTSPASRSSSR